MTSDRLDAFELDPHLRAIRSRLAALGEAHQIAFAMWCCDRLFHFYASLSGFVREADPNGLRQIQERLWEHVCGRRLTRKETASLMQRCSTLEFGEEGNCEYWDGAIDAVGATMLALQACLSQAAENASRAAGNVLNPIEQQLIRERLGESYVLTPRDWRAVSDWMNEQPRVMEERALQFGVLDFLKSHPTLRAAEVRALRSQKL